MLSTYSETKKTNNKSKFESTKIYVNEPLWSHYRKLLGKCNCLLKKNQLNYFYTVNGKLEIKYDLEDGEVSAVITHGENMPEIFGVEMMKESKANTIHNDK